MIEPTDMQSADRSQRRAGLRRLAEPQDDDPAYAKGETRRKRQIAERTRGTRLTPRRRGAR